MYKCRSCKEIINDLDERTCEICGMECCKHCVKKVDKYANDGICEIYLNKIKQDILQRRMF